MDTEKVPLGAYRRFGKRAVDFAVASSVSFVLLPLFAIIALMVRRQMGSPVLFRQWRPGKNAQPFVLYKFRTMTDLVDSSGRPLPDAERLTSLGRWLRTTSMDELPELFNVLKGDMSLVGPRPLLMKYLELYTPEQTRRHEVRPGITGWAQVNGRNALSWQAKFEYDVWYVDRFSFILDIRILYRTLCQVLSRTDIDQPGSATAEEFKGGKDG